MSIKVEQLFANDIHRRIEEVIKVDQTDEQIVREEISEYWVTDDITKGYLDILEAYRETPQKPHEGVGIWVSGFFGSGKSSFAKMIGLALENRQLGSESASALFAERLRDDRGNVLLSTIAEQIPTSAVIFDVSTDRGIRTGNQTLTEIMYRLFLESLGYARDIDLAELEITLEAEDKLQAFEDAYRKLFNQNWDDRKNRPAFALQQASQVMHELEPDTFHTADSWRESAKGRADVTPGHLASRCKELMARRRDGQSLVFVVDEVGQFVARDIQKMLDLQAIVQNLGRVLRGKAWIVVTSQEKLNELVGGIDDRRVELARLMDRFPLQVHLEPSDISEVTSKRVLAKNADAEKTLRELFTEHRGRLSQNTRLSADIKLPELSAESFIDLYPLLPYQVDLIIQVVSGLRMQGGASKHVGGANRTIIKLAQQLLIHPDVDLAGQSIGVLARIDQMYDLVAGNIGSEIRGKIVSLNDTVEHDMAQPVAKAICLLQYVKSIHRTPENIAAALHPAADADSVLPQVQEALAALEKAHQVRRGEDGYRIPTPAEDDWERQRASLSPKPGDVARIHAEVVSEFWKPQPSHTFLETKQFKAGLVFNGRQLVDGDIPVHLALADADREFAQTVEEMRKRSQTETKSAFWINAIDDAIDRQTVEVFRSKQILTRKERGAKTKDETALVSEEKIRLNQHHLPELRRLLRQSMLSGTIFFRGNDRSPDEGATDIGRTASRVLQQVLPEVFDRFQEAAARVSAKDLEALLTTENLIGLPSVFTQLDLVRDENGTPVLNTDSGPLAEVMARIENRTSYGESATGRYLEGEFAKEPFGWEFDAMRLFVVSLVRAGKLEATSKGKMIESALCLDARNTFPKNNLFRQAAFQPKSGSIEFEQLVEAADHYKDVFGEEVKELEQGALANAIRGKLDEKEDELRDVHTLLASHSLPGAQVLLDAGEHMRAIRNAKEGQAILTFVNSHQELKEAIKRSVELQQELTEPNLLVLGKSRQCLAATWPFLDTEQDLDDTLREKAAELTDLMARETFYRSLPEIDQHSKAISDEYDARFDHAVQARGAAYTKAVEMLHGTPSWEKLDEARQQQVAEPLASRATTEVSRQTPIPQLRADVDACPSRLSKAIEELMRILDGERIVQVRASGFFSGGIETEEQLDQALTGLREECEKLIGEGKKILVQ